MSKKDFIALADLMRDIKPRVESTEQFDDGRMAQWKDTVDAMADFCRAQNGAFKRDRWLSYIAGECGPNGGAIKK